MHKKRGNVVSVVGKALQLLMLAILDLQSLVLSLS